jgi:hypothetical protein
VRQQPAALDTIPQIRLFGKLKLEECARPGNRAGFFVRGRPRASTASKGSEQMPFQPGQSGNPDGRPRGARNKRTIAVESLMEGEADAITRKAIDMAKDGHMAAIRLVVDRLAPACRDRPVAFELPPLTKPADAVAASAAIAAAVAAGDLTPSEAANMSKVVDAYVNALEAHDLEGRVAVLEGKVDKGAINNGSAVNK